jgi:hypothetical protein
LKGPGWVEIEVFDLPSLHSSLCQGGEMITFMKMANPDVAIDTANLLVGTKAFALMQNILI